MIEIKFTLDATHELIGALRDIAGAIHSFSLPMPARQREQKDSNADTCDAVDNGQNLTNEVPVDPEQAETPPSTKGTKKRKPRAKKAQCEGNPPVVPAVGDDSSPVGDAEPERATQKETNAPDTHAETEPAPVAEDPAPGIVTQDPVEETPAPEPSPVEEAPADQAEDPLAGKGQTGEILAELTRKAIGDLDALGVDRGDANRRIRDYCARNEIKFPTFPALLQAVGYAEAIAICKGA